MGVQGLWTLVAPAARPVRLETLRNKKLAVDASIWLYQFMRAMRDKDGNALRNGHILGFFRRICKLLFYNIKPVFVFDGGAPTLKRTVIKERRRRREDMAVNLKRTAEKLLTAQVKSRMLIEEEKRRLGHDAADENYTYLENLGKETVREHLGGKRKRDQYELPPLEDEGVSKKQTMDPRLATGEELTTFVEEFMPSELDMDSETFHALPPEIQYELIQDIKLKSRQTSWARLDEMVRHSRTAMDFSKQQIKQLAHRNDMTQRLLKMNEATSQSTGGPARVAGERGREYILVKNDNAEQGLGWSLPGVSSVSQANNDTNENKNLFHAEAPLTKDTTSDMDDSSLEEGSANDGNHDSQDKVSEALKANPQLAALVSGLLESDSEEERSDEDTHADQENVNNDEDSDEPLFMPPSRDLNNNDDQDMDHDRANHDLAVEQVVAKMYADDIQEMHDPDMDYGPLASVEDIELSLSADDLYKLWLSRVPDAFIYLHSLDDGYKKLMRQAIHEDDMDTIQATISSVQVSLDKTTERDELERESLTFHLAFLKNVSQWKGRQGFGKVDAVNNFTLDDNVIIDDDDDDDNDNDQYRFESPPPAPQPNSDMPAVKTSSPLLPHIDLSQSSLQLKDAQSVSGDGLVEETMDKVHQEQTIQEAEKENTRSSISIDTKDPSPPQTMATSVASLTIPPSSPLPVEDSRMDPKIELQHDITEMSKDDVSDVALGYNSDEELVGHVQGEEDEYARFVADMTLKNVEVVRQDLQRDVEALHAQRRKAMGASDDVTQQMIQDVQELLRLFGIPYLVAPMEAEAQCAELQRLGLVEGVVTDDSDVFLFGATRVYKNMFNQQKYVECYVMQDIERDMKLNRDKLVQLAFLLGSDYTSGLAGIGPVAAMEILAEFVQDGADPLDTPLQTFRDWYLARKDTDEFQRRFRKKHPHLEVASDFPPPQVIDAYYHPVVDHSEQPLLWGIPELDTIRQYLLSSLGWPEHKIDEILLPVIREINKGVTEGHQTTLTAFFDPSAGASSSYRPLTRRTHQSKRVRSVIDRWQKKSS